MFRSRVALAARPHKTARAHNRFSDAATDEMPDDSELIASEPLDVSGSQTSDSDLVARARGGDDSAFEELFIRHKRRVAIIGCRFFSRAEQIEELVQETFTKAYFALNDLLNQRNASFGSWLARIAYNSCYDELRRLKRRPETSLDDLSDADGGVLRSQLRSTVADVERQVIARDLAQKLVARLSPEDRMVLVLLDAEGMSVTEISAVMGWSTAKVKVRAHRSRAALRRVLTRFL